MIRLAVLLVLLAGIAMPAAAADDRSVLARARQLYNARDFDAAIAAADDVGRAADRADGADLIAARALLERYRGNVLPDDLKQARERAIETMRKVRLAPEFAERYPVELSGGMQKRAALARAIIARPEIIFFDEPTTGLDPITADAINDLIVDMTKDLGCAAVSITHDMASARKIADEIAMLYQGKIIWRGSVSSLDNSGDARVDQFIHGRADGPIQAVV